MSTEGEERAVVKTYVPAYQKEIWREHAEALGMSQSEFVRSMVQAGRSGFELGDSNESMENPLEHRSGDVTPGGNDLEDRVLAELSEPRSWEELLTFLTGDVEDRLDEVLETLQERNEIRYSGRDGGYVAIGENLRVDDGRRGDGK